MNNLSSEDRDIIYKCRSMFGTRQYISPFAVNIAEDANMDLEVFVDRLQGKYPEVDDKDNGYLPFLSDANFDNDGEATYAFYSDPLHRLLPAIRQTDGLTRVHYNAADWGAYQKECGNVGNAKNSMPLTRICDAWHNSNPNGRVNYLNWVQSHNPNNDPTKIGIVTMINSEGDYCPANCIVEFTTHIPIVENYLYPKAFAIHTPTVSNKSNCRKSKLSESFKEELKWAREKCMHGSPPDALMNLSEHPEFRGSDAQFLVGKFEEIDDYDIPEDVY